MVPITQSSIAISQNVFKSITIIIILDSSFYIKSHTCPKTIDGDFDRNQLLWPSSFN